MNAIVEARPIESGPVETTPAVTPMQMLQIAVERGADLDRLEKLMDLQQRWEASQAQKAYIAAITRFKAHPPEILKRKRVYFEGAKGTTDYMHATLADVCEAAIRGLAEVGISHRWEVDQQADRVAVTCVLTHEAGHSERTTLNGPMDPSGSKNAIQAIGSAVTYLQRYTLLAATGLAAKDMDDDGHGAAAAVITEAQLADLEALISEVGANRANFLRFCKVDRLEALPAARYRAAVEALEAKRKG